MKVGSIAEMLFTCEAIKIAPVDKPFLYTSGLIGPFYINTHYLCGGKDVSESLLLQIDQLQDNPISLIKSLPSLLEDAIASSEVYSAAIVEMLRKAEEIATQTQIQFITGGQRRDWFFSIPLASRLNIPHLYLFNDGGVFDHLGEPFAPTDGNSFSCLHIADLLTVGSSYLSKWIPSVSSLGGSIVSSLNCVDRNQGGEENLVGAGIPEVHSLIKFGERLFQEGFDRGQIAESQIAMLLAFIKDPFSSMREFLLHNPDFIRNALKSDEKSKTRISLTIKNDLYKLGDSYLSKFEQV